MVTIFKNAHWENKFYWFFSLKTCFEVLQFDLRGSKVLPLCFVEELKNLLTLKSGVSLDLRLPKWKILQCLNTSAWWSSCVSFFPMLDRLFLGTPWEGEELILKFEYLFLIFKKWIFMSWPSSLLWMKWHDLIC